MSILFKLISSKNMEIKYDFIGDAKYDVFKQIFKTYGLTEEEFEFSFFVVNSEKLIDKNKVFKITENDCLPVFVFSISKETKEKLFTIFEKNQINQTKEINNSPVDPELTKPIVEKEEESIPELTDDVINQINEKTISLFKDDDFKHLIRIYYTNPTIMQTFFSFISHGDIININMPKKNETIDFNNELVILKSLGIKETDENITQALRLFNGHINLTLRFFLCKNAVETQ